MNAVELTFKYTQKEFVKAERKYMFGSKIITKTSVVIEALYFPFSIWYLYYTSANALSIVAVVIATLALIMGCIRYIYEPMYRFKRTAKYQEEYNLILGMDGIKFKTPTIHSELNWEVYVGLWESDECYYLVQASRMYTLIPKRAFADMTSQQAFEEIALSQLKCDKKNI